jgi:hypothetical protein
MMMMEGSPSFKNLLQPGRLHEQAPTQMNFWSRPKTARSRAPPAINSAEITLIAAQTPLQMDLFEVPIPRDRRTKRRTQSFGEGIWEKFRALWSQVPRLWRNPRWFVGRADY